MFVGRRVELHALVAAIEADEPVVVTGEAGIGKTALVREATAICRRHVHAGGALGTLRHRALLAVERALARSLTGDPLAAVAAIEDTVGPGVLVLDDLQWAHDDTLAVARVAATRVAVVAAVRTGDDDATAALKELLDAGFREVPLDGLEPDDALALTRALQPGIGAQSAAKVVAACGGNPLLVEEMAWGGVVSSDLRLGLRARLEAVEPGARGALAVLSLARGALRPEVIGAPLDSLVAANLAVVDASGARVRHALLADAAIALLDEDERRRAREVLATVEAEPGDRAHHHAALGDGAAAAREARAARAQATTPAERASWGALAALVDADTGDDERLQAAVDVANADGSATRRLLDSVRGDDPVMSAARDALVAVVKLHETMDLDAALADLHDAADRLAGTGSPWEARVLADVAAVQLALDPSAAVPIARDAAAAAERDAQTHPANLDRARLVLARALLVDGRDGWDAELQRVLDAPASSGSLSAAATTVGAGMRLAGRPSEGIAATDAAAERLEEMGMLGAAVDVRIEGLSCRAAIGRFEEVAAAAGDLLDLPLQATMRSRLEQVAGRVLAVLGRHDEAERLLRAMVARSGDGAFAVSDSDELAAALWLAGDARAAAAVLDEARNVSKPQMLALEASPVVAGWVADALGAPRRDLVARPGLPSTGGTEPAEVDALLLLADDPDSAVAAFIAAAAQWRPRQVEDALRCAWAAGEAARRAGRGDARVLLEAAADEARGHGAQAFLDRCDASLALLAGRRRPARAAAPATTPLSRREGEVMRLVGEGLTSVDIAERLRLSRRTVDAFVASAMQKLGARTRREASAIVAR